MNYPDLAGFWSRPSLRRRRLHNQRRWSLVPARLRGNQGATPPGPQCGAAAQRRMGGIAGRTRARSRPHRAARDVSPRRTASRAIATRRGGAARTPDGSPGPGAGPIRRIVACIRPQPATKPHGGPRRPRLGSRLGRGWAGRTAAALARARVARPRNGPADGGGALMSVGSDRCRPSRRRAGGTGNCRGRPSARLRREAPSRLWEGSSSGSPDGPGPPRYIRRRLAWPAARRRPARPGRGGGGGRTLGAGALGRMVAAAAATAAAVAAAGDGGGGGGGGGGGCWGRPWG